MRNQIETTRKVQAQTGWQKLKQLLNLWALALDYDPITNAQENERRLIREVECLKSRIKAPESLVAPATN